MVSYTLGVDDDNGRVIADKGRSFVRISRDELFRLHYVR
jgi:hypothetical protein